MRHSCSPVLVKHQLLNERIRNVTGNDLHKEESWFDKEGFLFHQDDASGLEPCTSCKPES